MTYFPVAEYWWFYLGFTAFVLLLLALDLGVFHRKAHAVSFREASLWSVVWIAVGAGLVVLVPFLLRRRRPWFERWILSRRDFARLVAVFMVFRVVAVARVVLRSDSATVPAPWGGLVSYRAGGAVFLLVTLAALALVARAAWAEED